MLRITLISVTLQWVLPALAVIAFMWRTNLANRLHSESSIKLFGIGVSAYVVYLALRFTISFLPVGSRKYAFDFFLNYAMLPLKFLLLFGAVRLLISLKPYVD